MCRAIQFICMLINHQITVNACNEASQWCIVQSLRVFQWRIPSIWHMIHKQAQELLSHQSKSIRDRIAK